MKPIRIISIGFFLILSGCKCVSIDELGKQLNPSILGLSYDELLLSDNQIIELLSKAREKSQLIEHNRTLSGAEIIEWCSNSYVNCQLPTNFDRHNQNEIMAKRFQMVKYPKVCFTLEIYLGLQQKVIGWSYFN